MIATLQSQPDDKALGISEREPLHKLVTPIKVLHMPSLAAAKATAAE